MTAAQQPGTDGIGADLLEVGTEVVREVAREVLAPAPWTRERSGAGDEGLRITAVRTFLTGDLADDLGPDLEEVGSGAVRAGLLRCCHR